jgi:hypothetical protein
MQPAAATSGEADACGEAETTIGGDATGDGPLPAVVGEAAPAAFAGAVLAGALEEGLPQAASKSNGAVRSTQACRAVRREMRGESSMRMVATPSTACASAPALAAAEHVTCQSQSVRPRQWWALKSDVLGSLASADSSE